MRRLALLALVAILPVLAVAAGARRPKPATAVCPASAPAPVPRVAPASFGATARAAEASLQSVEDLGSGQNPRYRWTWRVVLVGLGGAYGADEAADVPVLTDSPTALPGAATRCTAYRDYVAGMAGSHNTLGPLGCDTLPYVVTSPL